MDGVVSKGQFATLVGVSPGQVSHWLRKGKIHGDAIVGVGRHTRIRVAAAPTAALAQPGCVVVQGLGANRKAVSAVSGANTAAKRSRANDYRRRFDQEFGVHYLSVVSCLRNYLT